MFLDLLKASPVKQNAFLREAAPVPDVPWKRPAYFPELRGAAALAVDTETKELDWTHGPGWGRGTGHIIGVSVAAVWANQQRWKGYFPVRHEVEQHDNFDPRHVFGWLGEQLSTPIPKVGANLLFDCGYLADEGIRPAGPLYDVQFAEALIDEAGRVELGWLGRKYTGAGKEDEVCKQWILKSFPGANNNNWKSFLWRTPPRLTGAYAETDADLPLDVLPRQWNVMQSENTLDLYSMECRSIPMLIRMRQQGIVVDLAYTEKLRAEFIERMANLYTALRHDYAVPIESVNAPTQLARLFDSAGIPYPRTASGKPSFKKEWLEKLEHPVGKQVNEIREIEKLLSTFIDNYILGRARADSAGNNLGRIYCSFHPLRNDSNGAKTGRYSSSDPNLQNIPARTELGVKVRGAFVPEPGHAAWHKKDHSQIEYRMLAHYAVGARSEEIKHRYQTDPTTDYHQATMEACAPALGKVLSEMSVEELARFRKPIKNINFGLLYGQNAISLAFKAGMSMEEATKFVQIYHAERPFVRTTMNAIQSEVQAYGFITTILGRRLRFNEWESSSYDDKGSGTFSFDAALAKFGAVRRAFAYRGVNYKFQGSAADVLKKGMLDCYEQGVYDFIGFPKLTVHDELDWSKREHSKAMDDAFLYAEKVLENAVQLSIPLKVDSSEGINWSKAK